MDIQDLMSDLPEIIVEEGDESSECTFVSVGGWTFCVEDDLQHEDWWVNARAWVAYAVYLEKLKEKNA